MRPSPITLPQSLCFEVPLGADQVVVYMANATLQACFGQVAGAGVQALYAAHRQQIDAAALRRAGATTRRPMVLRVADL